MYEDDEQWLAAHSGHLMYLDDGRVLIEWISSARAGMYLQASGWSTREAVAEALATEARALKGVRNA